MNRGAVLRGVFLALRQQGLPLGVRDYLDALRALRAGFGAGRREALRALCETLWVRTEEERRVVRFMFDEFPFPTTEEVRELGAPGLPPARSQADGADVARPQGHRAHETPDHEAETLPVEFVREGLPGSIDIPRARTAVDAAEAFVLSDRPAIPVRNLTTAWRRFRQPLRTGPPVELDVDATIAAKCRRGLVAEAVLIPARRNQAKLTILIDVSDSMLPWSGVRSILTESLAQGQLGAAAVYHFANVPSDPLFKEEDLFGPTKLATALRANPGSCLLVVSDAGASRGRCIPARVQHTADFLRRVRQSWSPVAWLNPMPLRRWQGSSAEQIARLPLLSMHELSDDGVIEAVDALRGYAA